MGTTLAGAVFETFNLLSKFHGTETNAEFAEGPRGFYPFWAGDLRRAGFLDIQTSTYDEDLPYSIESWCGRTRAIDSRKEKPLIHSMKGFLAKRTTETQRARRAARAGRAGAEGVGIARGG